MEKKRAKRNTRLIAVGLALILISCGIVFGLDRANVIQVPFLRSWLGYPKSSYEGKWWEFFREEAEKLAEGDAAYIIGLVSQKHEFDSVEKLSSDEEAALQDLIGMGLFEVAARPIEVKPRSWFGGDRTGFSFQIKTVELTRFFSEHGEKLQALTSRADQMALLEEYMGHSETTRETIVYVECDLNSVGEYELNYGSKQFIDGITGGLFQGYLNHLDNSK